MADDKAGRRSTLTPEKFERIIGLIRNGNYQTTAAAAAGVPIRTFFKWIERGKRAADYYEEDKWVEPSEELYYNLYKAVEQARAEAEASNVLIIRNEANKTWQAAAWMLERAHPDRWGRRDKVDATVNANVSFADGVAAAWEKRKQMRQEQQDDESSADT